MRPAVFAALTLVAALVHDVETPLGMGGFEDGADLELGWRGGRIRRLGFIGAPSPYAFVSAATGGRPTSPRRGSAGGSAGGCSRGRASESPSTRDRAGASATGCART